MMYTPNKCKTCGRDIFPHWKYCQEHTKGNILLDMDITAKKKGVSLHKQEMDRLWRLLEDEMKAHALLKEQYARAQDIIETLAKHGVQKLLTDLSTPPSHKD